MRYVSALLLLGLLVLPTTFASAQETSLPRRCFATEGPFAGQDVFARYEARNQRLILLSWTTGEVLRELETSLDTLRLEPAAWSPGCRFLVGEWGDARSIAVWDVIAARRVGSLEASAWRQRLNWSPDLAYLVVQTRQGGYLWHLPSNTQALLNPQTDSLGRSFFSIEWDIQRNQLLAVQIGSANGVTAYDLASLRPIAFFDIGERSIPVQYRRSGDDRYLLVYSSPAVNDLRDQRPKGVALWDRDTLQNIQLKLGVDGITLAGGSWFTVIGDLTTPYLIIDDGGMHFAYLYIWNLQQLAGSAPYAPNVQIRLYHGFRGDARLVNPGTLEVASWSVAAYTGGPASVAVYRVDLATGTVLYQAGFFRYYSLCVQQAYRDLPEPQLLEWACRLIPDQWNQTWGVNEAVYWTR